MKTTSTNQADIILEEMDDYFCVKDSFSTKKFNKTLATMTLKNNADELSKKVATWFASKNPKQLNYSNTEMLQHILYQSQMSTDDLAAALLKSSNLTGFIENGESIIVYIFRYSSDELFTKFVSRLLGDGSLAGMIHLPSILNDIAKMKQSSFTESEIAKIFTITKQYLSKNKHMSYFGDMIPVLSYLLKYCDGAKVLFEEQYKKHIGISISQNSYTRSKQVSITIKAIRAAKNKELRVRLVKSALLLKNSDINNRLIKAYPKYARYIPMI